MAISQQTVSNQKKISQKVTHKIITAIALQVKSADMMTLQVDKQISISKSYYIKIYVLRIIYKYKISFNIHNCKDSQGCCHWMPVINNQIVSYF